MEKIHKDPAIAGILSFLIPGLGQIYNRQYIKGIVSFLATTFGYYLLIIPGLIIHLLVIIDAVGEAKKINN